jgi:hypothetical protein
MRVALVFASLTPPREAPSPGESRRPSASPRARLARAPKPQSVGVARAEGAGAGGARGARERGVFRPGRTRSRSSG